MHTTRKGTPANRAGRAMTIEPKPRSALALCPSNAGANKRLTSPKVNSVEEGSPSESADAATRLARASSSAARCQSSNRSGANRWSAAWVSRSLHRDTGRYTESAPGPLDGPRSSINRAWTAANERIAAAIRPAEAMAPSAISAGTMPPTANAWAAEWASASSTGVAVAPGAEVRRNGSPRATPTMIWSTAVAHELARWAPSIPHG